MSTDEDCTFANAATKRSPPKAYVDGLEKRIQLLEQLIQRVAPNIDIDAEVGPSFNRQTWAAVRSAYSSRESQPSLQVLPQARSALDPTRVIPDHAMSTATREDAENSDDEKIHIDGSSTQHLQIERQALDSELPAERRFHGKSSSMTLLQAALILKEEVTGVSRSRDPNRQSLTRRSDFWRPNPWEWMASTCPPIDNFRFPPHDLTQILIDRCFDDMLAATALSRPVFEQQYAKEMHRTDIDFARLLLLVCAVGARFCKDTRVCLTSPDGETQWKSAGWVYFAQVYQIQKPLLATARLVDMQIAVLSALYLTATSAPHGAWLTVGAGLRAGLDIGAHREKVYVAGHAFENQSWKRAFWCLVVMDKLLSSIFGRPICISEDDIDAKLPLEVDDDNWDEATKSWPSGLSYLANYAKLIGILANAMSTIYSIQKSKINLGFVGKEWEERTGESFITALDSSLNAWLDALPDHLRWDPHMGPTWYRQAAALKITFYYVQITIHRPFIQLSPSSKRVSLLSLPSLAICTNAARATANILRTTQELASSPMVSILAFISGLVLMISVWEARRNKLSVNVTAQIADVNTCLEYLKTWEHSDVLLETVSVPDPKSISEVATADGMTSPTSPTRNLAAKRDRDDEVMGDPDQAKMTGERRVQKNSLSAIPMYGSSSGSASRADSAQSYASPLVLPGSSQGDQLPMSASSHGLYHVLSASQEARPRTSSADLLPYSAPETAQSSAAIPTASSFSPPTPLDPTWGTYHIAGSRMQGLQMLPGYPMPSANREVDSLSPESLWNELLGPWAGGSQSLGGSAPMMRPEFWGTEQMDLWNIPGMSGSPAAPAPPQQ
ncbi:hypothetical protein FRB97_000843 [Tulasnella sp. 331]|nr:hypothetical protein FRB97_000843 [Tulasnella sp. 331]